MDSQWQCYCITLSERRQARPSFPKEHYIEHERNIGSERPRMCDSAARQPDYPSAPWFPFKGALLIRVIFWAALITAGLVGLVRPRHQTGVEGLCDAAGMVPSVDNSRCQDFNGQGGTWAALTSSSESMLLQMLTESQYRIPAIFQSLFRKPNPRLPIKRSSTFVGDFVREKQKRKYPCNIGKCCWIFHGVHGL